MSDLPLEAHHLSHTRGDEVPFHAHRQGQLIVVAGGTAKIYSEQGWWLATSGSGVWIPPLTRHRAAYTEMSALINLRFAPEFAVGQPTACCLVMVSNLLRELAREATGVSDRQQLQLIAALMKYQLRHNVVKSDLYVPEGADKRLRAITGALRQNPGCADGLAQLAARAFTSPRTVARLFEKETGMTFSQWRERLRMITAVERLACGHGIAAVALEMGYQSASSFTAVFTRLLGMPPRRYINWLTKERRDV